MATTEKLDAVALLKSDHRKVEGLFAQFEAAEGDGQKKALAEQIAHHVEEEEQRVEGMFSQARKAGLDMDALGETMAAEKQRLIASYKAGGLPTPETPTLKATTLGQPSPA